jgi:hypothetical protein
MENSPSALLQAELSSLSTEKLDLQRKVDQATSDSKAARQKLMKAYQVRRGEGEREKERNREREEERKRGREKERKRARRN